MKQPLRNPFVSSTLEIDLQEATAETSYTNSFMSRMILLAEVYFLLTEQWAL